ncbi:MAG: hypothetical protein JJE13_03695 [Thermoleophilia bacterium]|nr:hypothetical protein [Thermoleophilia bacterium]
MYELHLDPEHVLILNGKVIEMLRADQSASELTTRFHVRHIAVELKPKRDGSHRLRMGLRRDGGVWNLCDAKVPPEKLDDVQRFFEAAKREAAR